MSHSDNIEEPSLAEADLLTVQKHIRYCLFHLQVLPTAYEGEDCSRMSLAFFVLSALDLLNATDKISPKDRQAWIDWIYEQQSSRGGFAGGPTTRLPSRENYDTPHLAMTYTALCNLAILGDDFSRLDKQNLQHFVQSCQTEDGAFSPYPSSPERDVRFVYCAFAIRHFLGVKTLFRVNSAVRYILSCRSHDGAFGQNPGLEGQGGTTYCAIASLHMANSLQLLQAPETCVRWLSQRLVPLDTSDASDPEDLPSEQRLALLKLENGRSGGFQGRPEKDADVCYSFWVGAALQLLDEHMQKAQVSLNPSTQKDRTLLSRERFRYFLLAAQSTRGGISKYFEEPPDVYHTYLGLAGLAVGQFPSLASIRPELNISERAAAAFPLQTS
ncbi:terpenoid cyclases/Protein prenyltransferase [Cystobasidium minutum MCA 4210]|uniref:terpenoid cyclases/Protein prenyltransferase n=1 Tax=Cystobasidium minutum MCA 4210 TaxID=1397322 RepID=UPI0034CE0328|eukprot:jgi/Rhomi1/212227/estExt_Genemark1.C_60113